MQLTQARREAEEGAKVWGGQFPGGRALRCGRALASGGSLRARKGIPEVCAETDVEPRGEDTDGTEQVIT